MSTCKTCEFFHPYAPDDSSFLSRDGKCQRFPVFQDRYNSDVCGEYKKNASSGKTDE